MRRVALILAAVLPLTLAGCGDSTGPGRLVGTYRLESIAGDPLPADLGFDEQVTAGSVRLNDNGTFSASHTYRYGQGGSTTTVIQDINGNYTRSDNNITLTFANPEDGSTEFVFATWDGNRRLTVLDGSGNWVYEK